jgi:hypothetical protein
MAAASEPPIRSPVKSILFAFSAPIRYVHIAVVGHPQTLLGGYPILASSAMTTRSQHKAMSLPPATAAPWTCAIVGLWLWNSFA